MLEETTFIDVAGYGLFLVGLFFSMNALSTHVLPKVEMWWAMTQDAYAESQRLRCSECQQLIQDNDDMGICIKCGGFNMPLQDKKN